MRSASLLLASIGACLVSALPANDTAIPPDKSLHKLVSRDRAASWDAGGFTQSASQTPFLCVTDLDYSSADICFVYQCDGNFVAYSQMPNEAEPTVLWYSGSIANADCCSGSTCQLIFQGDGNLVSYQNGASYWQSVTGSSETAAPGSELILLAEYPYIEILHDVSADSGNVVFPRNYSPPPPKAHPTTGTGCSGACLVPPIWDGNPPDGCLKKRGLEGRDQSPAC